MSRPSLPTGGPLTTLRAEVEVLAEPRSPRRPWVVAHGGRVLKAYDLSHFDATDRSRLLAEAETALDLSDLEGVVTTYGFEVEEGWLMIEMERLGETLGDYLREVAAGIRPALDPSRWGRLFESVARTLDEVHRRRRLHRDVKPDNLIFDRERQRLLVADFSIAMRRPRGGKEGKAGLAGTRRYIAPEVMRGRVGPAADQYGLGVTAADALGKAAPAAAKAVLLRATEQNPADRYGSVADFGLALRAALDETAPRRISSRLQRVSAPWRQTWAVGAAAFAGAYALLLWRRPANLDWEAGLVLPLLAAVLAMLAARMFNPLRGKRSQPRLALADRGWFPALVFAVGIAAVAPLLLDNPSKYGPKYFAYAAGGALALSAFLGSVRRDAGERLISSVRRWERWREGQRDRRPLWWGVRLLLLAGVGLIAVLPAAVAHRWPRAETAAPADVEPISVVAKMRSAMLDQRWGDACALTLVPKEAGKSGCGRWVRLAAAWMEDDLRRGAPAFGTGQLEELRLSETEALLPEPVWRIRERARAGLDVGSLSREAADGRVWAVAVSRRPPADEPLISMESVWRYEVVRKAGRSWITAIEVCDYNSRRACLRVTQLDRSELPALARRGPPGGP